MRFVARKPRQGCEAVFNGSKRTGWRVMQGQQSHFHERHDLTRDQALKIAKALNNDETSYKFYKSLKQADHEEAAK